MIVFVVISGDIDCRVKGEGHRRSEDMTGSLPSHGASDEAVSPRCLSLLLAFAPRN